jgi:RNA polymerase sigma-70 factor (ECF subfamily)
VTDFEGIQPLVRPVVRAASVDVDAAFAAARPRLLRIATSLVGTSHADDVVQDTYLIARARSGQVRDPLAVSAWLVRICIHRSFRVNRRGRRLRELLDALPGRDRPAARSSGVELRELIDGLAPRERAVVVLQHGYGYSLVEIAQLIGVSHANARQIASRARARLLRAWQEAEG